MKRTFLFLLAAVLLSLGSQSCNREDNNGDNNGGGGTTSVAWVDLGLPSGLLWADRNVGADNAEDYGNYYAWGETAPKEVYDWSTYIYGNNQDQLTKYCNESDHGLNGFTDNLTTLEASDDAATVNIGDKARTPTKDEWQELMDNTTSTWTTQNGVFGLLLTASNGKSIFLPAAGFRRESYLDNASNYGVYWSSTLYDGLDYAWVFEFGSNVQELFFGSRRDGFSVRAVRANQD